MSEYFHISIAGDSYYYKDKEKTILHRMDGPAIEYANGCKGWYQNGKLHRMDGPALEWSDGDAWYINGKLILMLSKEGIILNKMR